MKLSITIIQLVTIAIYIVVMFMSFGVMEPNGLLLASLFVGQIFLFTSFVSTLSLDEYIKVPKGLLFYITNTISAVLILFLLFGQIVFWYMVIMDHIIIFFIAMILFKKAQKDKLLGVKNELL